MIELILLKVVGRKDEGSGEMVIDWDFEKSTNAYYMIGVLEVIKESLVSKIAEDTNRKLDED